MSKMRWLAGMLALVCLLGMTACGKGNAADVSSAFNPETDAQVQYFDAGEIPQFAESEDGYYYLTTNGFLRFIDKKNFEDTAVCPKPNCLHDSMESGTVSDWEACDAYVKGSELSPLFYYRGALYCMARESSVARGIGASTCALKKIALDGTSQETIWQIEWDEEQAEIAQPVISENLLHRGNFYFIVEDQASMSNYLFRYDMSKESCSLVHEGYYLSGLVAVGDQMFFNGSENDYEEPAIFRYTVSSGEVRALPDYETVTVMQDGLLFTASKNSASNAHTFTNYAGEQPKEMALPETLVGIHAVNDSFVCGKEGIAYYSTEDGHKLTIEEYLSFLQAGKWGDFTFKFPTTCEFYNSKTLELVESVELPEGDLQALCFMGDKVVIKNGETDGTTLYSGELSAVGTGNFQWQEIEKVN